MSFTFVWELLLGLFVPYDVLSRVLFPSRLPSRSGRLGSEGKPLMQSASCRARCLKDPAPAYSIRLAPTDAA